MSGPNEQEYLAFVAILQPYPWLKTPTPNRKPADLFLTDEPYEEIHRLYEKVRNSTYVKHLKSVRLDELFEKLEVHRVSNLKEGGILVDDGLTRKGMVRGKQLGEIRFLHRYAKIIKYEGALIDIPDRSESKKRKAEFAKVSKRMSVLLDGLLNDGYFEESLGQYSLQACYRLEEMLWRLPKSFASSKPTYPYERDREHEYTVAKVLIDWLASCCFRHYEGCDSEIIFQLLSAPWLQSYVDRMPENVDELVGKTLAREIANHRSRASEEPWGISSEDREWEPPRE